MQRKPFYSRKSVLLLALFTLLVAAELCAQVCTPPPPGMISWWPGDGNANDIQGPNSGALQGGVTFTPGKVGQAFTFDGTTGEVVINHTSTLNFGPTDSFSVDAWLKPDPSVLGTQRVAVSLTYACSPEAILLIINFAGTIDFSVRDSLGNDVEATSPASILDGQWHHVAGVRDTSDHTIKLYLDGALVRSLPDITTGSFTRADAQDRIGSIGVPCPTDRYFWKGQIDEVEVFGRALSLSDVQAIFNAGSAGKCKAPLRNISTRLEVLTGDNVGIAGFIIEGTAPKRVLIRGLGPTLAGQPFNVPGTLADPNLGLHGHDGQGNDVLVAFNDDWQEHEADVAATGLAPGDRAEAAILITLNPGAYTAILSGGSGNALVDAYDLDPIRGDSLLTNISTRGFVNTGDQVMIGGFIVGSPGANATVVVRALGPTLSQPPFNVPGTLSDPVLQLHDGNGSLIAANDDWQQDAEASQIPDGLKPPDPRESALHRTLAPGNYTGIVLGKNNSTGVAIVEVYHLP